MHLNKQLDFLFIIISSLSIILSYALGGLFSFFVHDFSSYLGSLLAAISAVIVVADTDYSKSLNIGLSRLYASFIGALIGYLYFLLFHYSIIGLGVTIFLIIFLALLFSFQKYIKVALIVLIWIFVMSHESDDSPLVNGLLRFFESALGVLMGLLGVWVIKVCGKIKKRGSEKSINHDAG